MQELIIEKVEKKNPKKEGGNPFYVVYGQGGEEMTTFDAVFNGFGKGTRINVEPKVAGRYVNIAKWEMLEEVKGKTEAPINGTYKRDTDAIKLEYELKARMQAVERASIEGQNALNNLCTLLAAPLNISEMTDWANNEYVKLAIDTIKAKIEAYTKITPVATPPKQAEPVKTESDKLWDEIKRDDIPEFTTGPELVNYAMKQGMKLDKIKETLAINNPTEIKDVKAASVVLFGKPKEIEP